MDAFDADDGAYASRRCIPCPAGAASTPPVQAPAAIRIADDASEKSKLEAAAETKKLDGAESTRQWKLADEKLARTEANWKKVMGSICTGCVPRSKPVLR